MQLRWSNGYSFAIEFEADRKSLAARAATALEQFQRQGATRFHDGATHRNMIRLPQAELHVGLRGAWWNPGCIQSTSGMHYFEPAPFAVFGATIENIDTAVTERFDQQAFLLMVKSTTLWEHIEATARWMDAITDIATTVADIAAPVWPTPTEDEHE